ALRLPGPPPRKPPGCSAAGITAGRSGEDRVAVPGGGGVDAEVSGGGTAVGGWGPVRSHGPFRVPFRSRTVSAPGEPVTLAALMLSVAESTGQALAVAALLLVGDFVPALPAPLTGVAADRSGPRRVMVGCGAVRAAVPAAAALWLPPLLTLVSVHPAAGQVFL